MRIPNKKESLILLLGDIVAFVVSLWLSLFIRNAEFPGKAAFLDNLKPFAFLFIAWIIIFFIAGLYEKQRIARRRRLPELLVKTQIFNSIVAIVFFYTIPYFGVTPKTILFLVLVISLFLSFFWRNIALTIFGSKKRDSALLIAGGDDAHRLLQEVNQNPRYNFSIAHIIDLEDKKDIDFSRDILPRLQAENIAMIIIDGRSERVVPFLPELYRLIFSKIQFVDFHDFYEAIFDRLPLSHLHYSWFLENITMPHAFYDALKRLIDIVVSVIGFIATLPLTLLAMLLLAIEGGGEFFSRQERVGQNGKPITLLKLRTMTYANAGELVDGKKNEVTKVGAFLRKTRIDEFPQFINVLRGDLSLIGPRPEFPKAVEEYSRAIPYYPMRHIIKPGLSGWAQIYGEHPHHGIDIEATKNKLSYDLFYVKRRSLPLDIILMLKTIKTLLSREGI